jgi:hypothetical protein
MPFVSTNMYSPLYLAVDSQNKSEIKKRVTNLSVGGNLWRRVQRRNEWRTTQHSKRVVHHRKALQPPAGHARCCDLTSFYFERTG